MNENILNVWGKLSRNYDTLWVQKYSLTPTREKILKIIEKVPFQKLLDMGCGTGQLLSEIKAIYRDSELFGIDKSIGMIEAAKNKNLAIDFMAVNSEEISYKEEFDIITCCHSLPYYENKPKALENVSNALKENGRAIFVAASINNIYDKLIMAIIESTAEKADYLSKKDFMAIAEKYFIIDEIFLIKEKWFMPSIYGFVMRKKI